MKSRVDAMETATFAAGISYHVYACRIPLSIVVKTQHVHSLTSWHHPNDAAYRVVVRGERKGIHVGAHAQWLTRTKRGGKMRVHD